MKRTPSFAAPLLALSLVLSSIALWAAEIPAVGSNAADFTLQSQEGKTVSLKDFKGQWVVLYFYPKDMTQGCTIEAHNFQRDLDQYTAKHAAIVGVSADTTDSHQQFCTKESRDFPAIGRSRKGSHRQLRIASCQWYGRGAQYLSDRSQRRNPQGIYESEPESA